MDGLRSHKRGKWEEGSLLLLFLLLLRRRDAGGLPAPKSRRGSLRFAALLCPAPWRRGEVWDLPRPGSQVVLGHSWLQGASLARLRPALFGFVAEPSRSWHGVSIHEQSQWDGELGLGSPSQGPCIQAGSPTGISPAGDNTRLGYGLALAGMCWRREARRPLPGISGYYDESAAGL